MPPRQRPAPAQREVLGTRMVCDNRTARQIFEEVMSDPDRRRFGFGDKLAVINIDFQNAYTSIDDYQTAFETDPEQIETVNRICRLARTKGMPVFWTQVAYMGKVADAGLWRNRTATPEASKIARFGARRHDFDERCEIDPAQDIIFEKRMPSAFFETPLQSTLVHHRVDTVVITGGTTSGCVRATAVDALSRGYRTIVPLETCADRHESFHFGSLADMQLKYADVEPAQVVLDWLDNA